MGHHRHHGLSMADPRRALLAAVLATLTPALPAATANGIETNAQERTYAIRGDTAAALREQMRTLGPAVAADGGHFAAWTQWQLQWHYDYLRDDGGCRIGASRVELTTTMTLPSWVDYARATPALRQRWDEFVTRLRTHEDGHREHGMQAARAVRQVIDHVGRALDCRTLGEQIDAYAHAAIAQQAWADKDYDARTRHGQTQGAQL